MEATWIDSVSFSLSEGLYFKFVIFFSPSFHMRVYRELSLYVCNLKNYSQREKKNDKKKNKIKKQNPEIKLNARIKAREGSKK